MHAIQLPDLQRIEDRFWVWVHYAATKLGRANCSRSSTYSPSCALRCADPSYSSGTEPSRAVLDVSRLLLRVPPRASRGLLPRTNEATAGVRWGNASPSIKNSGPSSRSQN